MPKQDPLPEDVLIDQDEHEVVDVPSRLRSYLTMTLIALNAASVLIIALSFALLNAKSTKDPRKSIELKRVTSPDAKRFI